jgi:Flp pilus assembly protein TadG
MRYSLIKIMQTFSLDTRSPLNSRSHSREARWYVALRCEKGNSLVEFALCISIVLTTVFCILGCSLMFYADHFVSDAASQAVRYAIVRGSSWNGTGCSTPSTADCTATAANVTSFVNSVIPPGITASSVSVIPLWPGTSPAGTACDTYDPAKETNDGTNNPTCTVTVTVSYSFNFLFPFLPSKAITLSSTAAAPIVM